VSVHPTKTGKYEVRYRDGRRNRSKTFTARRDAERFDADQKTKRERGEPIIRHRDTPYLDDFMAEWLADREREGKALNTRLFNASTYDKHLGPYIGDLRVATLTPQRLEEWRRELLAADTSPYMFNRALELAGMLLAAAKRRGFVAVNGARDLERLTHTPATGLTASPVQVEALRAHFFAADDLQNATLISVLAYVGLRTDEAWAVRWDNLSDRRFNLEPAQTKTKRWRSPEIPAPVLADLAKWRLASGSPEGLIFPRANGAAWSKTARDNWRGRKFKPAAAAAGLPADFTAYDLRHTCASLMLRAGIPSVEVAAHMGHGLDVLHRTYAHVIEDMKGKPSRPVADEILSARGGAVVRPAFGAAAG
jgi:integrase